MQFNLCDIIEVRLMNDVVKLLDVCNLHILFHTLLNISLKKINKGGEQILELIEYNPLTRISTS